MASSEKLRPLPALLEELESMIAHINVIEASGSLNPMIFERAVIEHCEKLRQMKKTMRKSLEQAGNDVEKLEKEIEEHKKFHSNIVDSVKGFSASSSDIKK